jgi:hypothetical protein
VPHRARVQLHNTVFSNINTITEEEMAAINFGIYKVVFDLPVRELDDAEFYEGIENLKFFVHRYDAENLHHDALVRIS